MARSSEVLILAMAKTNMATGRKKYGNIAVEKVFGGELGIRRPGDGNIRSRTSLFLTTLQTERVARCDEMWKRREKARKRSKEGKIKFVWTEWIRADPRLMRSSDYPCEE